MNPVLAKWNSRAAAAKTLLCVGLDPEFDRLPPEHRAGPLPQFSFCREIIDRTAEFTAAFKPNTAFFEARGARGADELAQVCAYLREQCPEHLSICDSKRADIGNTNCGYATAAFDELGCDAVTLHPYLGQEALEPFLSRTDKCSVVLCRTSNVGAGEFQDLHVDGRPLWQVVAERVTGAWDRGGNTMLVVGATYPDEMRTLRRLAPKTTFLVPGVGAQGGIIDTVVAAGLDAEGRGLILNASRAVLFSDDPAGAARGLRDAINAARERIRCRTGEGVHAAR